MGRGGFQSLGLCRLSSLLQRFMPPRPTPLEITLATVGRSLGRASAVLRRRVSGLIGIIGGGGLRRDVKCRRTEVAALPPVLVCSIEVSPAVEEVVVVHPETCGRGGLSGVLIVVGAINAVEELVCAVASVVCGGDGGGEYELSEEPSSSSAMPSMPSRTGKASISSSAKQRQLVTKNLPTPHTNFSGIVARHCLLHANNGRGAGHTRERSISLRELPKRLDDRRLSQLCTSDQQKHTVTGAVSSLKSCRARIDNVLSWRLRKAAAR